MEYGVELVMGTAQGTPWLTVILSLAFGLLVLWTGVQSWRGKGPSRNAATDQRSARLAASSFPASAILLGISLITAMAQLTHSGHGVFTNFARVVFVAVMLMVIVAALLILYIWIFKIPKFLTPASRRTRT
jgi:uncharacterized membrane protein YphA (DoxX/SURF4 family)